MSEQIRDWSDVSLKELALRLDTVQREAKELKIPAVVVIEGLDGCGKGRLLNRMIVQMDARSYNIYSTHAGDRAAREYPLLWRIWNHTPAKGRMQFFDRSAYYLVLDAWAEGNLKEKELTRYWWDIARFERQLADDGVMIIKAFLVMSRKEQARRFKEMESNSSTAWRVTNKDWKRYKQYDEYLEQVKRMTAETDQTFARWHLLETEDLKSATARLYRLVIAGFEKAIEDRKAEAEEPPETKRWVSYHGPDHLAEVDLDKVMERSEYKKVLKERQAEMYRLAHEIHRHRIPVVMAYCGWDAAGKGGCIKRLLQGIDPRSFSVVPIAAPTKEELSHHYLWRFWKKMPPRGRITLFDRSWYGRVLVERVEGLCSNDEWRRAYQEINEMEAHLADFGVVLIKFWLHIDKATQLERFEARQEDPNKQWKITSEDWRNREKFDLYYESVNEMVEKTNMPDAPWSLVPSTCKEYARIRTLDIAIERIKAAVKSKFVAEL